MNDRIFSGILFYFQAGESCGDLKSCSVIISLHEDPTNPKQDNHTQSQNKSTFLFICKSSGLQIGDPGVINAFKNYSSKPIPKHWNL